MVSWQSIAIAALSVLGIAFCGVAAISILAGRHARQRRGRWQGDPERLHHRSLWSGAALRRFPAEARVSPGVRITGSARLLVLRAAVAPAAPRPL
jgi:hypothetical protein